MAPPPLGNVYLFNSYLAAVCFFLNEAVRLDCVVIGKVVTLALDNCIS
jgi:hypothetical protein